MMPGKVKLVIVNHVPHNFMRFNLPEGGWLGVDKDGNVYGGSGWEVSGLHYAYRLHKGRQPQPVGWVELHGKLQKLDALAELNQQEVC